MANSTAASDLLDAIKEYVQTEIALHDMNTNQSTRQLRGPTVERVVNSERKLYEAIKRLTTK